MLIPRDAMPNRLAEILFLLRISDRQEMCYSWRYERYHWSTTNASFRRETGKYFNIHYLETANRAKMKFNVVDTNLNVVVPILYRAASVHGAISAATNSIRFPKKPK